MRSLFPLLLLAALVRGDDTFTCPETGKQFCTGALPTPPDVLAQSAVFVPVGLPPKHVAYVPRHRSMYGNDRYGICVTSEEAFAKSVAIPGQQPEVPVPDDVVISWAREHGVLNGAALGPVCDWMAERGFKTSERLLNDGPKRLIDYRDDESLKAAIALGPVKIAVPARTLGSGAGSRDGWHALGGSSRGSDHCVSLCGYGTAEWLYSELDQPLPSSVRPDTFGYLCYTWSTIGFVDAAWVRGNVREAWIRTPTTIGIPPFIHPPHGPGIVVRFFHLIVAFVFGLSVGLLLLFLWPAVRAILGRLLPSWLPPAGS